MARKKTGYSKSKFNAVRHGLLARKTVLPWENEKDYQAILMGVCKEFCPIGALEENFVASIASIIWRQTRLQEAEGALYRSKLIAESDPVVEQHSFQSTVCAAVIGQNLPISPHALQLGDFELQSDPATYTALKAELAVLHRAQTKFEADGMAATIPTLTQPFIDDWQVCRDEQDEVDAYEDSEDDVFAGWLDSQIRSCQARIARHEHAPAIRAQRLGQAYLAPALDNLARYEAHLDRRLEKAVAGFYRLKQMKIAFPARD